MFQSLISCFKNLRMRTQIIIFEFGILLLVLGLAGSAIYIQVEIFYYISTTSSETLINNTDIKQINQATQLVSHYINLKHQRNIYIIEHIAEFLLFFDKNSQNFTQIDQQLPCVTQSELIKHQEQLLHIPTFCYQLHGVIDHVTLPLNNSNVMLLYNSMSLLENYNQLLNINVPALIQAAEISNYSLDMVYPVGYIVNDYILQERPWYKNHIAKITVDPNIFYSISDVYKVFVQGYDYQFSITHSLFNKHKEFIGVVKTLLTINDPNFDKILYNVLLINYAGQILYNGMEVQPNQSEIFYIFNQSITGFNFTDWNIIEQHANDMQIMQFSQNCNKEIIVLYNKHHKQYVNIQSQKFQNENFTLIIFTNVSSIKIMEKEFNDIGDSFFYWNVLIASIVILVGIVSFMLSLICITIIFNPLSKLTEQVSQHVLQIGNNTNQYFFKKMFNLKFKQFDLINNLNDKFINFQNLVLQSQTRKSEQCLNIESLQYNQKESNFDSSKIQNQIKLVPFYSHYEQIETSKIVLSSLLQRNCE